MRADDLSSSLRSVGRFGRRVVAVCVASALLCGGAQAYVTTITSGTKSLYLVVGTGTMSGGGGTFSGGGTPGNNTTVNKVSVAVPAASIGNGTALAMTTDSTTTASLLDGYAGFCTVPAQVYVAGFYRTPNGNTQATLTVTSPANLTSGSNNLSFGTISWVSGGLGDAVPTIPSGTFVAGTTQTLLSVTNNTWFESCLSFNYANGAAVAAGTYTGRVTYTLTSP